MRSCGNCRVVRRARHDEITVDSSATAANIWLDDDEDDDNDDEEITGIGAVDDEVSLFVSTY